MVNSLKVWQIFSGEVPFQDVFGDYPVIVKVMGGQRPTRPILCDPWKILCTDMGLDDSIWALVEHCWRQDPYERPTMTSVAQRLPLGAGLSRPGAEQYLRPTGETQERHLISWACVPSP